MKLNPFQKRTALSGDTDLNITPFLSLMVVLIPVLLVSAKFSLLAQYDIYSNENVPTVTSSENSQQDVILPYRLVITADSVTLYQGGVSLFVGRNLDNKEKLIQEFKGRLKLLDKSAALSIQLEASLFYQEVVGLLDIVNQHSSIFSSVSVAVKEGV